MSRALNSATAAAIGGSIIYPAFFVSLQFANETVYLWSGLGNYLWNGKTWVGVGSLGGVSPIQETSSVEAQGITLTLSGIDPTLLPECLAQITTSGIASVYLAVFSNATAIIGAPYPAFVGLMDQPVIKAGTNEVTISLSIENRLSDLNRARGGRLTDQDQRARHPNDQGLLYVAQLQDMYVNWQS